MNWTGKLYLKQLKYWIKIFQGVYIVFCKNIMYNTNVFKIGHHIVTNYIGDAQNLG